MSTVEIPLTLLIAAVATNVVAYLVIFLYADLCNRLVERSVKSEAEVKNLQAAAVELFENDPPPALRPKRIYILASCYDDARRFAREEGFEKGLWMYVCETHHLHGLDQVKIALTENAHKHTNFKAMAEFVNHRREQGRFTLYERKQA